LLPSMTFLKRCAPPSKSSHASQNHCYRRATGFIQVAE
jgi:hypothetical protein